MNRDLIRRGMADILSEASYNAAAEAAFDSLSEILTRLEENHEAVEYSYSVMLIVHIIIYCTTLISIPGICNVSNLFIASIARSAKS
jgi:hypothetical protein